jgi:predicted metal-binding membrane protein
VTSLSHRASDRAFLAAATLLFMGSVAITIVWCSAMAAMPAMAMPGGWTMTMTWMRMPGQTWLEGAASFLGMWMAMMTAMMLPSLVPALWRCRESVRRTDPARLELLTTLAGAGYFSVWLVAGAILYPIGITLGELAMRQPELARAVPIAIGVVVAVGVTLQFTPWKRRQLACWRSADRICLEPAAGGAWRAGLRLGWDCVRCSVNLMAIQLVLGVMDLGVMTAMTAVITVEKFVPRALVADRSRERLRYTR